MLALALAASDSSFAGDRSVTVSDAYSGPGIVLPVGESLTIRLGGNAGTGYFWRFDNDNTSELVLSGRTTESVAMPGAPLTTIFVFRADAPGKTIVKASYVRSWEKGTVPDRTFNLPVEVTAP